MNDKKPLRAIVKLLEVSSVMPGTFLRYYSADPDFMRNALRL